MALESSLVEKAILLKEKLRSLELSKQPLKQDAKEAFSSMCDILETVLLNGQLENLPPFDDFLGRISTETWCVPSKTIRQSFYCDLCSYSSKNPDGWNQHLGTKIHTERICPEVSLKTCESCGLVTVGTLEFVDEAENNIHHLIYHELCNGLKKSLPQDGNKAEETSQPNKEPDQKNELPTPVRNQGTFQVVVVDPSKPITPQKHAGPPSGRDFYDWFEATFIRAKDKPLFRCDICCMKMVAFQTFKSHLLGKTHLQGSANIAIIFFIYCKLCNKIIVSNDTSIATHLGGQEHIWKMKDLKAHSSVSSSLESLQEPPQKPGTYSLHIYHAISPVMYDISSGMKKILSSCKFTTYWNRKLKSHEDISSLLKESDFKASTPSYVCIPCKLKPPNVMSHFQHIISKKHTDIVGTEKESFLLCGFCEEVISLNKPQDIKFHLISSGHRKKIIPLVEPLTVVHVLDAETLKKEKIDKKLIATLEIENLETIKSETLANIICTALQVSGLKHGSITYLCELCQVKVQDVSSCKAHSVSKSHQQKCKESKKGTMIIACELCKAFIFTSSENSFENHVKGMMHMSRKASENPTGARLNSKELVDKYAELWRKFELSHIVDHDTNDYGHEKYTGFSLDDESILAFIRQQTRSQHDFAYSCSPCRKEFLFNPEKLVAHLKTDQHLATESFYGICCHICGAFIVSSSQDTLTYHINSLSHIKDVAEQKKKEPASKQLKEEFEPLAFAYITSITGNGTEKIETPQPTGVVTNDADYITSMVAWVEQYFRVKLKKFFCCQCVISTRDIKEFLVHRTTKYHLQKERTALNNLLLCIPCAELHMFPKSTDFSYHIATSSHAGVTSSNRLSVAQKMESLQSMADKLYSKKAEKSKTDSVEDWRRSAFEANEDLNSLRSGSTRNDERSTSRATSALGSSSSSVVMETLQSSKSDLSLDSVLKDIKDTAKITKSAKRIIKFDLQALLADHFPSCEIYFLGSRELGIGRKEDALDIIIDPGVPIDKAYVQTLMRLLNSPESLFKVIDPDPGNRIMTTSLTSDFPCCFHLVDPSIVDFSKLIKTLKDLDERVQYSLVAVRLWAEENMLTREIPAYCFDWLVLFYLMLPPMQLLPPIQLLQDMHKSKPVKGTSRCFETDVAKIHEVFHPQKTCLKSSTEILDGFYEFYSVISFKNIVMSPLTGKRYKRSAFETTESIPDPYPRTNDFSSIISDPVVLIDPLSRKTNLFASVSNAAIAAFQEGCRNLVEDSDS